MQRQRLRGTLLRRLQGIASRNHRLLREKQALVCSSFPVLGGVPGARPLEEEEPHAKQRAGERQCRKCQSIALPKNFGFCAAHRTPTAAQPEKPPSERLEYYRWSYLRFARVSVIKHLVHCHQYSRYLEVGADCGQCFSRIRHGGRHSAVFMTNVNKPATLFCQAGRPVHVGIAE